MAQWEACLRWHAPHLECGRSSLRGQGQKAGVTVQQTDSFHSLCRKTSYWMWSWFNTMSSDQSIHHVTSVQLLFSDVPLHDRGEQNCSRLPVIIIVFMVWSPYYPIILHGNLQYSQVRQLSYQKGIVYKLAAKTWLLDLSLSNFRNMAQKSGSKETCILLSVETNYSTWLQKLQRALSCEDIIAYICATSQHTGHKSNQCAKCSDCWWIDSAQSWMSLIRFELGTGNTKIKKTWYQSL